MSTKNETPLWLELRKEYIDDNFEHLLPYLRERSSKLHEDVFYRKTIKLLQERVAELSQKLASVPIYEKQEDNSTTVFNIRLLASYLLVSPDDPVALHAEDVVEDVDKVAATTACLFFGYFDGATTISESCGGGGGNNELPKKKDNEDELFFALRCHQMAKTMHAPKYRLRR